MGDWGAIELLMDGTIGRLSIATVIVRKVNSEPGRWHFDASPRNFAMSGFPFTMLGSIVAI